MKIIIYILLVMLVILPQGCRRWVAHITGQSPDYSDATRLTFLCMNLAIYTDVNEKLPGNINDKEGKPLLSWRVELLRYGGSQELALYKQFKLDEPWNSPHNMKVALTVPFFYIDPNGPRCTPLSKEQISPLWQMDPQSLNYTPYLAVVGPKTAFSFEKLPKINFGYAAIVVVDKSNVFWTEPRDISVKEAKKGDVLRWYGGKSTKYLTPRGEPMHWEKEKAQENNEETYPEPKYEYEPDK